MNLNHQVSSLAQFVEFVNSQEHQQVAQWLFRGHSDSRHKLIPGLFRIDRADLFASWDRIEAYIIENFKAESRPYLKTLPDSPIEWLAVAQHYGLPTRLLDWTANPLVALFFAVENYKNDCDANVWLYGLSSTNNCKEESTWIAKKIDLSTSEICEKIIFPPHIDLRITNQSGCFTIHDLPEGDSPFVEINLIPRVFDTFIQVTINKNKKKDILNELYNVGIHRGFIYPGLEGITARIKFEIETTHKRPTRA